MSVVGVVLCLAAYRMLTSSFVPGFLAGRTRPIPLLAVIPALIGAFFVYRHTARRRKTQAFITIVLTLALSGFGLLVLLRLA
jgi:hypothetical protein